MNSLLIRPLLFPALQWWSRLLQSDRAGVSRASMIARAVLHTPVFAAAVFILRARLLLLGPIEIEAATSRGLRFGCLIPDLIQMYLALFGVWEPDVTAFIESRLGDGDVFVDVGANVGWLSIVAAQRVGGTGRVVALEPSPSIHAALLVNAARNGVAERIRAVRAAASDEVGHLTLHAGPAWNTGLASAVARRGLRAADDISAAPLDDLVSDDEIARARIIKVDVEGGEDRVLRGMVGLLPRLRKDVEILVELSPLWWSDQGRTPDEVLRPFIEAGFHAYEIANNYWPWRYLWPNRIHRPRRVRHQLDRRVKRLDIVLSRSDLEVL